MSILIKGMEMPTEATVIAVYKIDGKLYATRGLPGRLYPLVPVPDHGRLIDADALIDWIYSDEPSAWKAPFRLCTADRSDVKFLLKQAPTIIEAEEEGTNDE